MDKPSIKDKIIPMLFSAIIAIFTISIVAWGIGMFFANDFAVPNADLSKFKNVLIIFPHADDEVLTTGGLIGTIKKQGGTTTLVVLTKGEKGTPSGELKADLKDTRTTEMQNVSKILGVTKLIQEDFGDGELTSKRAEVKKYLAKLIADTKPDLIITYDLSGMYGHPDHITAAEITTEIATTSKVKLWYATYPKIVLGMMKLPERMATDPLFKNKRMVPNIKVPSAAYTINKLSGVYAHTSQRNSFESAVPVRQIPLWYWHSMPLYEYFYEVKQ